MKQGILILLTVVTVLFTSCLWSTNDDSNKASDDNVSDSITISATVPFREDYQEILTLLIEKVKANHELSSGEVLISIPLTKEEFSLYYGLTSPDDKESIEAFYTLDNAIVKLAATGDSQSFKDYLNMAEFVDGEYAESYFEEVAFVISNNKDLFCKLYSQLSAGSVLRLADFYVQHCK